MAEGVVFDYQKLTPHELRVLDLIEERSSWTILEFQNKLLEQEKSSHPIVTKNEDKYRDFLKQRPKLFGKYIHTSNK